MTNTVISVYEQYNNCKMVIKIGSQPYVTYNNICLDNVIKFILSHQELLLVVTNSKKIYDILSDRINVFNIELQFRVG